MAREHGLSLREHSDLLLRAHLAAVPPADGVGNTEADGGAKLDAALDSTIDAFNHAHARLWTVRPTTQKLYLTACARHGRLDAAVVALDQLTRMDTPPGLETLDELLVASHHAAIVDAETMRLWLDGSAMAVGTNGNEPQPQSA